MKKNGFTLVELLASLAILGLVLAIGIMANKRALATSLVRFRNISDNEVFEAARNYVIEENVSTKKGYTCVYVSDLVDSGYLDATNDENIYDKMVKVSISKKTKVINKIEYVKKCK